MAIDYTTTALIASVKRRISAPTSNQLYAESDFLAVLNEAQREVVVPAITTARQHYFQTYQDTTLSTSQTACDMPPKAVANTLVNVEVMGEGNTRSPLVEIQPSQLWAYGNATTTLMMPMVYGTSGYYVQDNQIILQPTPTGGGTLRMTYNRRRNTLVATTSAAQITAINSGTGQLTLSSPPSTITTVSASVDVIKGTPAFTLIKDAVTVSAVAGSIITIPSVTDIAVGDWVAVAGETPIAMLPYEAHDFLAQAAAVKVEESGGNPQFVAVAQARLAQIREDFLTSFVPRIEGQARKLVNLNGVF